MQSNKKPVIGEVTSKDGTIIAFDQYGEGPAIILVTGVLGTRSHPIMAGLAELLAPHFTVLNYDRRGRGGSTDTAPYAVEREIEDIEALIDTVGGAASLYGLSSGAVLALEAANKIPSKVIRLAMYEPPFIIDDSFPPVPKDYVKRLNEAVAEGRRGDAVTIFMTEALRIPAEFIDQMREAPIPVTGGEEMKPPEWTAMEEVAHTLAYDGIIMGDTQSGNPLPSNRWTSFPGPTLGITGEESEVFFHHTAQALTEILPNTQHRTLEGQGHRVAPQPLAPVLVDFFKTR